MEINKDFWLKLKEDYKPDLLGKSPFGFCYFSNEFESLWLSTQDQDVIDLANQFLESEKGQPFSNLFYTDCGYLFTTYFAKVSIQDKIEVRKQFLDWIINNLENETSTSV